jgi:fatty-acyl-CoA synthase
VAETLLDYFATAGQRPDGGVRFVERDESEQWCSWSELCERAERVAGGLQDMGIAEGESVALVFPTGPSFVIALLAVLRAGAVPVPLYPPVRLGRLAQYLERTGRMIAAAKARLVLADGQVKRVLGEAIASARPELGCRTLETIPKRTPSAVAVSADALGLIQFSSGTTVEPKPVGLSHRALVAQVDTLSASFQDRDDDRHSCVSWLPLYHDMGLIGCLLTPLARDAQVTLIGPELFVARPAIWLRALSRHRGTISAAPNFGYSFCVQRIKDDELDGVDLSAWEVALSGAEMVVPGVARAFVERFRRWGFSETALTPVYGLSEATLGVTFAPLHRRLRSAFFDRDVLATSGLAVPRPDGREIVSVGKPLPGFVLSIRDGLGQELQTGQVGRVWVTGPSLMDGYVGDPIATARVLKDGWLDTGDLGFVWEGELHLTGRAKDVLLVRGRNHSPEEVERAVNGIKGVRMGCVAAVSWLPERADGEVLALFVERGPGASSAEVAALPEECRGAVLRASGLALDEVVVLAPGTLPRTSSGKLRRAEALRLYLRGELTPPLPVTPLRMAGAVARSSLAYARLRWMGNHEPADATED